MTWTDITLKQYIDIDTLVKDTELDDTDRILALCQAVYRINLLDQPLTEYKKYVEGLAFLKDKMPDMTVKDKYTVNGTTYNFCKDLKHLTVAQYMDYTNYQKGEKSLDTYANILTVFLIPEGCNYNEGYDIVKARQDMLDLSAPDALSIATFFLTFYRNYIKVFLLYSMSKVARTKMPRTEKKKLLGEMRTMINSPRLGEFCL